MRAVSAVIIIVGLLPGGLWAQNCKITVVGQPGTIEGDAGGILPDVQTAVSGAEDELVRAIVVGGVGVKLTGDTARAREGTAVFSNLVATSAASVASETIAFRVRFTAANCEGSEEVAYLLRIPQPRHLIVVRGVGQGAINQRLAQPPIVEVQDQFERPFAGATVTLTGATVPIDGHTVTTLGDGRATFTDLVVRGRPGGTQPGQPAIITLAARVAGVTDRGTITLSIREPIRKVVVSGPDSAVIGRPLSPPLRVKVTGNDSTSIPGVAVALYLTSGRGTIDTSSNLQVPTTADGYATFEPVVIRGRPGVYRLVAVAGDQADSVRIHTRAGPVARLLVTQQAPTRTLPDSIFDPPLVVAAEDTSGNPVAGVEIVARICRDSAGPEDTTHVDWRDRRDVRCRQGGTRALLRGPLGRFTDSAGLARFDSLRVSGPKGVYYVWFCTRGSGECNPPNGTLVESAPIRYDPDDLDRSYVVVSAIKSIAGEIPSSEFFDLRFRFRLPLSVFLSSFVDLALTNRSTDTVRSDQKALTEASAMLSVAPAAFRWGRSDTDFPHRTTFVGATGRVFNTVPYVGVHAGSLELAGSPFHGSSGVISLVVPMYANSLLIEGETIRPSRSLLIDFFIRSSTIDFFKVLNARGAVLVPLRKGERVVSRITIAIPVGDLVDFF